MCPVVLGWGCAEHYEDVLFQGLLSQFPSNIIGARAEPMIDALQ